MRAVARDAGRTGTVKVDRRLPGFVLTSVVIALAVSACSSGPPSAPAVRALGGAGQLGLKAEPPLGPVPVINGPASMHLPLDPYFLAPGQILTVDAAERKAEQACIHRYLPRVALGTYGLPVLQGASSQPLVYLDPAQAARYGYHDPVIGEEISEVNLETSPEALAVDDGNVAVVNGVRVPPGGCRTVGVDAVIGGIPSSRVPTGNARQDTVAGIARIIDQVVVQNDSRIIAVNRRWSSCMAGLGYDYLNPGAAVASRRWFLANVPMPKSQRPPITSTEVRTAVADVTCRSRAGLYGLYWAVAAAYQNSWLANGQNHSMAGAQQRADQLMLTRADTILGG
jgi:hypothetical protein